MKWRQLVFVAVSAIAVSAQTTPPPASSELMTHYRAYVAALDSGNLVVAESEAEAALQSSMARDGEGGRTGVLATNLAQVRLSRGRTAEAYAPALQAFNISSTRAGSNVDPLLARLVLGRAELTEDRGRQGSARLEDALASARARPELHDEAYNAAADLGHWYANRNLFASSATAWALAAQLANPEQDDRRYAYAEARLGEGIARYSQVVEAQDARLNRATDTRIRIDTGGYVEADAAFAEAERILRPLAYIDGGGTGLTGAQSTFALALAWRSVLGAYLISTSQQRLIAGERAAEAEAENVPATPPAVEGASGPLCEMRLVAEPRPNFPPGAELRVIVGAVIVRTLLNEQGEVVDSRVAAAVPQAHFREAVELVAPRWTVVRAPTSSPNCGVPRILFWSSQFRYFQ